jgi:apolipoprotein D and lipocalin family protein
LTRASLLLVLLAACGRGAAPDTGFRNLSQPISSMAVFEQSQLEGSWREVAGYQLGPCHPSGMLTISEGGRQVAGTPCYLPSPGVLPLTPSGPGRFRAGGLEIWVLWVDADDRTLVLGTPSGSFGAVLNRGGPIPEDRLEAARRVLAFNGYDIDRLEVP